MELFSIMELQRSMAMFQLMLVVMAVLVWELLMQRVLTNMHM